MNTHIKTSLPSWTVEKDKWLIENFVVKLKLFWLTNLLLYILNKLGKLDANYEASICRW